MAWSKPNRSTSFWINALRLYCMGDPNVIARLRVLHVLLALRAGDFARIADAGCGRSGDLGWLGGIAPIAYPLSRLKPKTCVEALDRDPLIIQHNLHCLRGKTDTNLRFAVCDLADAREFGAYDAVVFSDIARSLRLDGALIQSAVRMVGPRGRFVMICPSKEQRLATTVHSAIGTPVGFDPDELREFIQGLGLRVQTIKAIIGPVAVAASRSSQKLAQISFPLLVLVFPFIMAIAVLDFLSPVKRGEKLLAVAERSEQ